jgi:hypothetical protein
MEASPDILVSVLCTVCIKGTYMGGGCFEEVDCRLMVKLIKTIFNDDLRVLWTEEFFI